MRTHTLEAKEESEVYTSFGLGYGVDATDPSPLRCKHGKIRTVLPNLSNVEEAVKKERGKYSETIFSTAKYSTSVGLSVTELVAKGLSLPVEAEFSRKKTDEMMVTGKACWLLGMQ